MTLHQPPSLHAPLFRPVPAHPSGPLGGSAAGPAVAPASRAVADRRSSKAAAIGLPPVRSRRPVPDTFFNHTPLVEEDLNPRLLPWLAAVILVSLGLFLAWAATAPFKQLSHVEAEVAATLPVQRVEAAEPGTLTLSRLREGQEVMAGQELARIDTTALAAERAQLAIRAAALEMDRARLDALLADRLPDFAPANADPAAQAAQTALHEGQRQAMAARLAVLDDERAALEVELESQRRLGGDAKTRVDLVDEQSAIVARLRDKGARPRVDVLEHGIRESSVRSELDEIRGEVARLEAALSLADARRAEFVAATRAAWFEERAEAVRARDETRQAVLRLDDRIARAVIRAPSRGIVMEILVPRRDAVVAPGDEILRIAPALTDLRIAARIDPREVGRLRPGQPVLVRFPAYDDVQAAPASGRLVEILPTTSASADGRAAYRAYVALDDPAGLRDQGIVLHAGMAAQVNVVGEDRTLVDYLFKPMRLLREKLFTQR